MKTRAELSRIGQIFLDGVLIDRALRDAARAARLHHKREGLPLVIYRDGKVVLARPEELEAEEVAREVSPE